MKNATVTLNRTLMTLVVIAILAAVLLSACGGPDKAPMTVPEGAQAGDLIMESCMFEVDKVEYAAECGTLVVPENRSDPNSRLIALPVIRIPATGSPPTEPIFWFQGGPGKSNMRFSHLEGLIEDHDIVMVGYRGADGSVVLDCPEISEALRNPPGGLLSDAALESYGVAAARCAGRVQSEGVDLAGYTMTETMAKTFTEVCPILLRQPVITR